MYKELVFYNHICQKLVNSPLNAGISKLKLNSALFENGPIEFDIGNVTLLVGPNNSGKSQMLRDIYYWLISPEYKMKLLQSVDLVIPTEDAEIELLLEPYKFERKEENDGDIKIDIRRADFQNSTPYQQWVNLRQFKEAAKTQNILYFRPNFTKFYSILLEGRQRFNIISPGAIGNTTLPGENFLAIAYRNESARRSIRKFVFNQFGTYLYFSPHDGANLNLVLNETPDLNETSLKTEDTSKLAKSVSIFNFGDGIQCLVGLLLASYCYPFKILLIDEPEAHLHPPTSTILARDLSNLAVKNKSSLIIATHSPDFLIGCLESSHENMSIIRLTYDRKIGSARLLNAEDIKKFHTDPLLRTTETLNSLFHNSAIVCEADIDKVFYSEINRRLLAKEEGILDTIFLNAQNKQTIHRIAGPLRKVGIPSACIFDLDVLNKESLKNEDTTLWEKILTSLYVPNDVTESLEKERSQVEENTRKFLDSKNVSYNKPFSNLQIQSLSFNMNEEIQSFLDKVKKYGIFIVPVGQLEDWPLALIKPNTTGIWLVDVLQFMEDTQLQPRNDDVWEFLREINEWISNPKRLGMPT